METQRPKGNRLGVPEGYTSIQPERGKEKVTRSGVASSRARESRVARPPSRNSRGLPRPLGLKAISRPKRLAQFAWLMPMGFGPQESDQMGCLGQVALEFLRGAVLIRRVGRPLKSTETWGVSKIRTRHVEHYWLLFGVPSNALKHAASCWKHGGF